MQDKNNKRPNISEETPPDGDDTINQIFDKILKRILFRQSKIAIINLINGLYDDNFPSSSEVIFTQQRTLTKI